MSSTSSSLSLSSHSEVSDVRCKMYKCSRKTNYYSDSTGSSTEIDFTKYWGKDSKTSSSSCVIKPSVATVGSKRKSCGEKDDNNSVTSCNNGTAENVLLGRLYQWCTDLSTSQDETDYQQLFQLCSYILRNNAQEELLRKMKNEMKTQISQILNKLVETISAARRKQSPTATRRRRCGTRKIKKGRAKSTK